MDHIFCWSCIISGCKYEMRKFIPLQACMWINQRQSSVRTQQLISSQLLTCFCPAPFIWLVSVWGRLPPLDVSPFTHSDTDHLLLKRACFMCCSEVLLLDYCRDECGNQVMLGSVEENVASLLWEMKVKNLQMIPI